VDEPQPGEGAAVDGRVRGQAAFVVELNPSSCQTVDHERHTPACRLVMTDLTDEIAAYDAMRSELETKYLGKWALVRDRRLVGTYDSFEAVAAEAVSQFGRGPYLIRQVGAPPMTLPASVMHHPV